MVKDSGRSIVQARAAALLSERSDKCADVIQSRLESARREIVDLPANLEALSMARTRLASREGRRVRSEIARGCDDDARVPGDR